MNSVHPYVAFVIFRFLRLGDSSSELVSFHTSNSKAGNNITGHQLVVRHGAGELQILGNVGDYFRGTSEVKLSYGYRFRYIRRYVGQGVIH